MGQRGHCSRRQRSPAPPRPHTLTAGLARSTSSRCHANGPVNTGVPVCTKSHRVGHLGGARQAHSGCTALHSRVDQCRWWWSPSLWKEGRSLSHLPHTHQAPEIPAPAYQLWKACRHPLVQPLSWLCHFSHQPQAKFFSLCSAYTIIPVFIFLVFSITLPGSREVSWASELGPGQKATLPTQSGNTEPFDIHL